NHEKQVSIQILFGAKRQENTFYTTSQKSLLPPAAAKDFLHNPTPGKSLHLQYMDNYEITLKTF
ncbi:MAG: hypothetical protein ACOYOO_15420, partial [Saprospiraceae bacterium]